MQVRVLPGPSRLGRANRGTRRRHPRARSGVEPETTRERRNTRWNSNPEAGSLRAHSGKLVEFVPRSAEFVKEAWQELKKVHWPTRKETYSATVIVVVVVVVVAAFLGVVDFALSYRTCEGTSAGSSG